LDYSASSIHHGISVCTRSSSWKSRSFKTYYHRNTGNRLDCRLP